MTADQHPVWRSGRDPNEPAVRKHVARALLIAGRVLPLVTTGLIVLVNIDAGHWRSAPLDPATGFTTAWLPNLAFAFALLTSAAAPFIVLPIGSAALVQLDGTTLVVRTVLGRRRIMLPVKRSLHARMPGERWGADVLAIRGSTGFAVVVSSEFWRPPTDGVAGTGADHLRGWALMLCWVLVIMVGATAAVPLTHI